MWNYKPKELEHVKCQHILSYEGTRFVAQWEKPKSSWFWTFELGGEKFNLSPKQFSKQFENVEYISTCLVKTNRHVVTISNEDGKQFGFDDQTHSIRVREDIEGNSFSFLPTKRKNISNLDENVYPVTKTESGYEVYFDTHLLTDVFDMVKGKHGWVFCSNKGE